jgi:homoserine O-acetyltransferase
MILPLLFLLAITAAAQTPNATRASNYPLPVEGDFVIRDFKFDSGETLPELKLHYRTIGEPKRDASGAVRNAVLIMHGTGGSGAGFLSNQYGGALFGPGQLLDATKYFIILPDGVGHGKSSKPSDGLRARFPHYAYNDMVTAQYKLLTEGLKVNHLRLVMGTSMGGMQTWLWGEKYPDFMDALAPLASLPVQISGRNRMMRRMVIDSIKNDPEWNNGDYKQQPTRGLTSAIYTLLFMTSAPLQQYKQAPTRDTADKMFDNLVHAQLARADANDMLYAFDASRDYDPAPDLEKIRAPLIAINSADDQVNPPELGIVEKEIKRVKRGRYVLIPISDKTRGHGTHSLPELWKQYLAELLDESNGSKSSSGQQRKTKKSDTPVLDYEAEIGKAPSSERKKKSSLFNGHGAMDGRSRIKELPPGVEPLPTISHWWVGLPALPVAKSDAIVLGEIVAANAYLSDDQTGIYSEFSITVEELLKDSTGSLSIGSTVPANRLGGGVRFASGRINEYRIYQQGMPLKGSRYILFVSREKSGVFTIVTGYGLSNARITPLDGEDSDDPRAALAFSRYKGAEESRFLQDLRTAIQDGAK